MTFRFLLTISILALAGCAGPAARSGSSVQEYRQMPEQLLAGEVVALAYSGFREGQHPDRGDGAVNPSADEILEDLQLMVAHGFRLVRMYDSGPNTAQTLALIREHDLPLKVTLGIWLAAERSNHLRCEWLTEPIPLALLAANKRRNEHELARGIALAREYGEIVVAINVGNEALVDWTDHLVPLARVIDFVREVKAAVPQPVTVAENYLWWIREGRRLAAEVDFLGVHTYPQWEGREIDEALAYTIADVAGVHAAHPDKDIVVMEAGWATVANEFGARASEALQLRYFDEVAKWARESNITLFFFEAFDEPWKGAPNDPWGAEKHWGLFNVDRTPKPVLARQRTPVERE